MEQQILDSDFNAPISVDNAKWAGFWIRVGATIIDVFAMIPIIALNFYDIHVLKSLPLQLAITALMVLYKPFMEFKYGATLGKMAVKIKVVNKDFGGLSLSQAIIRDIPHLLSYVVSIYSTVLLFMHPDFENVSTMLDVSNLQNQLTPAYLSYITSGFGLICCLIVAFTKNKQGLHDMMANTYCIYK